MNLVTYNTILNCQSSKSNEKVVFEKSKDNKNIAKICFKNKEVYLGNYENVQNDIKNFIKTFNISNTESDFIIFGLGSGEHILELINMEMPNSRFLIIEPRKDVIQSFLSLEYADNIINDERVFLCLYNKNELSSIMGLFVSEFNLQNTKCSVFANYADFYYKEILEVYDKYFEIEKSLIINMNTHIVHSGHFFNSYMNNLETISQSYPINTFKDIYKDMTAVVVSAGPSLSKNIKQLKEFQDKFIIITGGRTLKVLTDIGIQADFLCVIDPDEPAFDVMKDSMDSEVPLVYSEFTNSKVVKTYKGSKVFFTDVGAADASRDFFETDVDNIFEGGSVAHVCAGLAAYIGCKNIIFIGQDFAYTGDMTHDINAGGKNNLGKFFYTEDIYGGKVKTDNTLYFYKKSMEEFIDSRSDINFINCTEGGANIKGTRIMKLKDALNEMGVQNKNRSKVNDVMKNDIVLMDKSAMKQKMEIMKSNLNVIREMCKSAVEQYKSYFNFGNGRERDKDVVAYNFNITNKCIFDMVDSFKFINILLSSTIINIVGNPNFKEKNDMNDEDKLEIKIHRNLILYNDIIKAVNEIMKY